MIGELSGFLINSHNILDVPRLQPKTFVNVGGLQIKRVLDTLPEVWKMCKLINYNQG